VTLQPTSFRWTPEDVELLDAIKDHLAAKHGFRHSRLDALRSVLKRVTPPEDAPRWQRAYRECFGPRQGPE
jgi:hypothetical protein